MAYEQKDKTVTIALWDKTDTFKTGTIEFHNYSFNGISLSGLKIPIKVSLNKYKTDTKHPSWKGEENDWKPGGEGKLTKPEHAMALAASIKQKISHPVKPNDEPVIDEPTFDEGSIPF